MISHDAIDDYLRRNERVCAAVIAYSQWQVTPRCAASILRDACEHRPNYSPWIECCYNSNPRLAIRRAINSRHTMRWYPADYQQTLRIVRTATRPTKPPLRPVRWSIHHRPRCVHVR